MSMTLEIGLTLAILLAAMLLFISEKLRVDVVALLVLVALAITGLVTPDQALAGFSNGAVITVWGIFILSGGLARTGVASFLGRIVLRFGDKNWQLLLVMMLVSAFLSAFMNNVGVTAMLLPVVLDVARRTKQPASRLLIPLAFSSLLGGTITIIGTPPNILASDMMVEMGFEAFRMFDYAPLGLSSTIVGILFLVLFGRFLLPKHASMSMASGEDVEMGAEFAMDERMFMLRIPEGSDLADKTLAQSHLGAALHLNVIGIMRNGETLLAPDAQMRLAEGDQLLVIGRPDHLKSLGSGRQFILENEELELRQLTSSEVHLAEVSLSPRSKLVGKTLEEMNFRTWIGANVLAIWRDGKPLRMNLQAVPLQASDTLLLQSRTAQLTALHRSQDFLVSKADSTHVYHLEDRLLMLHVPEKSHFAHQSLAESNLADAYGLTVLGIIRNGDTKLMPGAHEMIEVGDRLLVKGRPEDVSAFRGLQSLEFAFRDQPDFSKMQSEHIGMVEAVLSPQSTYAGKSLRQINFREKYGLSVLALWRSGRAYRFNIRDMSLRFGDALLIYGQRSRLQLLAEEQDFLMLTEEVKAPPRTERAVLATLIMASVIATAVLGWMPIALAAVTGGLVMVLTGCLTMDEAYRAIEWKAVFLIAGMLPMGIAMQNSGTAQFLADQVIALARMYGPMALVVGIFILTSAASQIMPNPVVALIMGPIAIKAALDLGYSPYSMMMVVAIAASSSFLTPVAHHSNVIIMGPGGYKFKDYFKVGLPLTLLILLVTLVALPIFWPL